MKFAVIGGDMRQAKLAEALAADGHLVSVYGLDKIRLTEEVAAAKTAAAAAENADCVVLPLPVVVKEGLLNTPLSSQNHLLCEILQPLKRSQLICAGRVDACTGEYAQALGLTLQDYFAREELAVSNAVATAEGAIQIAMEELPTTLSGQRVLVLGFGRIGKVLAHKLAGLGARVAVSARSHADLAWIHAYGYEREHTEKLKNRLGKYDLIINTVPSRILDESLLREVKTGCLCLDLASKPGGMDFAAASKLGVKAVWALSLPGEVAPVTSGQIIKKTIYNIMNERGVACE